MRAKQLQNNFLSCFYSIAKQSLVFYLLNFVFPSIKNLYLCFLTETFVTEKICVIQ